MSLWHRKHIGEAGGGVAQGWSACCPSPTEPGPAPNHCPGEGRGRSPGRPHAYSFEDTITNLFIQKWPVEEALCILSKTQSTPFTGRVLFPEWTARSQFLKSLFCFAGFCDNANKNVFVALINTLTFIKDFSSFKKIFWPYILLSSSTLEICWIPWKALYAAVMLNVKMNLCENICLMHIQPST